MGSLAVGCIGMESFPARIAAPPRSAAIVRPFASEASRSSPARWNGRFASDNGNAATASETTPQHANPSDLPDSMGRLDAHVSMGR